ncbi:MAG TPA: hypothetical protein VGL61_25025 [Kofleriaceae bacterium]
MRRDLGQSARRDAMRAGDRTPAEVGTPLPLPPPPPPSPFRWA